MAGLINGLTDILKGQKEIYEELLALSAEKREYIVCNNVEKIKKITSEENTRIGKIQRLDKSRRETIRDIAVVLNEKESNITLSYLADIIKEQPEYEDFSGAAKTLKQAVERLREVNDANRLLLQNALDYIDFNINVIRSTFDAQPATYSMGENGAEGRASFLDFKN